MTEYANFRQHLDAVLRTGDVKQVQAFLMAQSQWSEDTPADPERAMWIMIAANPALRDLHERAGAWLKEHGHVEDAQALLGKGKGPGPSQGKAQRPARPRAQTAQGNRPAPQPVKGKPSPKGSPKREG